MNISVCTLYEGDYYYGVLSLVNSLIESGFCGQIYIGFRGELSPAFSASTDAKDINGNIRKEINKNVSLVFVRLDTDYHLTNYKPYFMEYVFTTEGNRADAVLYYDPDIIQRAPWTFMVEWISCGIALCEDINSPLPAYHPRRVAWRNYFRNYSFSLTYKTSVYVNGGFVGVSHKHRSFLAVWGGLQEKMGEVIGGLTRSSLHGNALPVNEQGPFRPFSKTDQDALNAAVEAWEGLCSIIGKEAMGFTHGVAALPHALGQPKPWNWLPIYQALKGLPPRAVDRAYWQSANGTLQSQPAGIIKWRLLAIKVAAFIGRFYRKGGL